MIKTFQAAVFLVLLSCLVGQATAQSLKPGRIHSAVAPDQDSTQTYSLYLPKDYTDKRSWPVLFGFSPSAEGRRVVELHQDAAEKFGWIIVASEVSRNGPMTIAKRAGKAMWADITSKYNIDRERLYAAGLSGGAIAAGDFATTQKTGFAGVFLHARGDYSSIPKKKQSMFYLLIPGDNDFNLGESVRFLCLGRKTKTTMHLSVQPGGHSWADKEACSGFLRYAELSHRLDSSKKPDRATTKLAEEEFEALVTGLHGPYFLCAWQRLEELVGRCHKSMKLHRKWKKLMKVNKERLTVENKAWEKMSKSCLFDAAFENRMPSVESLRQVDTARRRLATEHSGTTAVHLVLLSQKNAPASFNRAIPRIQDEKVKKAYREFLEGLAHVGIDFVEEARKLTKKKKNSMALVALFHGAAIGQLNKRTLKQSDFKSLKKLAGYTNLRNSIPD